ncbi:MAG: bifunctional folylpolyglutamate synthase/dihydrofolate synthase [Bacteroides sp.]|nr:bifunctional folylpolyglutamate synthase/dihydrofolate synthase [Bacteroides sp.]MCM1549453.1 bifunctional folylpolyglutamate synthase/dihydrofolate synthase [Clostridium sp.]
MDYSEAMNYMTEKNKLGSVPGLERIQALLLRLGEPQNQCKVIHIAGTNGKGSILAYLDAILQDAGYRVGRYISPTVFCYLERFQVNGRDMEAAVFADYLTRIRIVAEDMEADGITGLTAFEIETALAFLYFQEQQVDFVLLETGMGGRQDATNVVKRPLCTILAAISLDHMNILGETVAEIAYEKAGIVRDEVPCVIYPENEEAMSVLQKQCSLHNIKPILPDLTQLTIIKEDLYWEEFDYKKVKYKIGLLGKYQIYNALTAIEVIEAVKKQVDIDLDNVNIQRGLHNARWRGRFEVLQRSPYVIRDGAHNIEAARCLREQLTKHFTNKRIIYIIGILKDKEYDAMLALLVPLACRVYTVTVPDNSRALPAEELARVVRRYCRDVIPTESPEQAYELARAEAAPEDVILAFGSLYYIGRIGDQR